MRIAIDVDSTLHHYWDVLSDTARRRFGVDLPYEEQFTWGVTRLKPEQLRVCIDETHSEQNILAGRPYPGAVETINRWHEAGHFIHITSHRSAGCQAATARWLDQIGLRYDELYCSWDKMSRCGEIGIDLGDDTVLGCDAALLRGPLLENRWPRPDELSLVVEVSETTLGRDLGLKMPRYAAAGVANCWVIDGAASVVHAFSDPMDGSYRNVRVTPFGESLSVPGTDATITLA